MVTFSYISAGGGGLAGGCREFSGEDSEQVLLRFARLDDGLVLGDWDESSLSEVAKREGLGARVGLLAIMGLLVFPSLMLLLGTSSLLGT